MHKRVRVREREGNAHFQLACAHFSCLHATILYLIFCLVDVVTTMTTLCRRQWAFPSFFAANRARFFCSSGLQEENISLGLPQNVDVCVVCKCVPNKLLVYSSVFTIEFEVHVSLWNSPLLTLCIKWNCGSSEADFLSRNSIFVSSTYVPCTRFADCFCSIFFSQSC